MKFRNGCLVMGILVLAGGTAPAQTSVLSSVNDLVGVVDGGYATNSWVAFQIFPPSGALSVDAGLQPFDGSFDTNFLASLVCVSNLGVKFYPVTVQEATNEPRQRFYLNATGTVVYTSSVSGATADEWIEAVYGESPAWLSEEEEAQWRAERDRARFGMRFSLLGTGDVASWYTALSNALAGMSSTNPPPGGYTWDGTNVWICGVFPQSQVTADIYARVPAGVTRLDLFRATNATASGGGWIGPAAVGNVSDPVRVVDTAADLKVKAYAFGTLRDSDGDGLTDACEFLLVGTDPNNADTDGDGLSDGEAVLHLGLDPRNPDGDGDGLTDGEEVGLGLDPTEAGQDGAGGGLALDVYSPLEKGGAS